MRLGRSATQNLLDSLAILVGETVKRAVGPKAADKLHRGELCWSQPTATRIPGGDHLFEYRTSLGRKVFE